MNTKELLKAIDEALLEADSFVLKYYNGDETPMVNTINALAILKSQVKNNPYNIDERVLRAMHDIGATSVKSYENTSLEIAIDKVTSKLYKDIPNYKNLEPLRMDFGKGNPI